MDDVNDAAGQQPMSLLTAFLYYFGALFLLVMVLTIWSKVPSLPVMAGVIAYLAEGFVLNRLVLRRLVEWHPMYNTIANVSSAKLGMMVFWPIRYPILFVRIGIATHL